MRNYFRKDRDNFIDDGLRPYFDNQHCENATDPDPLVCNPNIRFRLD